MDKSAKTEQIIESLGKILSELDDMHQDAVAIKIAEAINDLSNRDSEARSGQDI